MKRGTVFVCVFLPLLGAAGFACAGLLPQWWYSRASASSAPAAKTWAFLYHFDDALGSTGPYSDSGFSNLVATGNNATVVITNSPVHTGFSNTVYVAGTAKRVHIGPEGMIAPGTNEFFVEGWFYLTAAQAATNASVSFFGEITNSSAGYKCFITATKGAYPGGRFDLSYSTNGASATSKTRLGYDMSALGDTWVHVRAGKVTNVWAAWVNGERVNLSSPAAAGIEITWTNASGWSTTAFTIGARAGVNSATAADEVGYWVGSYNGDNFTPPSVRTGTETTP